LLKSAGSGGQTGGFAGFVAIVLVLLASLFAAHPAFAQLESIDDYPDVIDARVTSTPQRARLIIDLSGPTEFAIVSLDKPNRIAIDVKAFELKILAPADVAGKGIVTSYTVEMAEKGRARTLLTLSGAAQVQQAYMLEAFEDQPARLVVDIIPATPEEFAANVARDLAASGTAAPPVAASSTPAGGSELPIATRPLVVIDPGHGGIDSGAEPPAASRRKTLSSPLP
jgi:N-acetylmuramoyl-L-alanine amidase